VLFTPSRWQQGKLAMHMEQHAPSYSLGVPELIECYRRMVEIRQFEIAAENAAAGGHIRGMIHSAVGQEAVAVGVCRALRRDDLITSTHRNHHHALAKGVAAKPAMAELLGRTTGCCGGKGGSMHITDMSVGMVGANGVVGASAVIAAGIAQALRLRRSDAIAVAFIGDGAVNRGQCLEAMNYAAVYHLPLLIVCEDNGWAATTRASSVTAGPGAVARARALGLFGAEADGNDVQSVAGLTAEVIARIRGGDGPAFLLFRTYRVRGHTCADSAKYRDPAEHEAFLAQDPIARCRLQLLACGVPQAEIEAIDEEAKLATAAALEAALEAAWPAIPAGYADIQTVGAQL
jgi:acetoin:2,6-dichlorophenolindophenol oxidoreductase subunit alpha